LQQDAVAILHSRMCPKQAAEKRNNVPGPIPVPIYVHDKNELFNSLLDAMPHNNGAR
jgi:hypothetical protein